MTTKRARARAPQHRLDHIPKYIPESDPAWDEDILKMVFESEDATVEIDGEVVSLYPLRRYMLGHSRFDLEEPGLREVIAKTKCLDIAQAEVWSLRVLPFEERLHVQQLAADGNEHAARLQAFAHGVVGLSTPEDDEGAREAVKAIERLSAKGRKAPVITELYEAIAGYRMRALSDVGWAVKQLSSDLSEEERRV